MLKSDMADYVETRGAKPLTYDKDKLAAYLHSIDEGKTVVTSHMRQVLRDEGYIEVVQHDASGARGRPGSHLELTIKAKRQISLWKAREAKRNKGKKSMASASRNRLAA